MYRYVKLFTTRKASTFGIYLCPLYNVSSLSEPIVFGRLIQGRCTRRVWLTNDANVCIPLKRNFISISCDYLFEIRIRLPLFCFYKQQKLGDRTKRTAEFRECEYTVTTWQKPFRRTWNQNECKLCGNFFSMVSCAAKPLYYDIYITCILLTYSVFF